MPDKKIRVLVADGSVVERERMVTALRADPDIEVVGEVAGSAVIVDQARRHRPDVIALSIHLPTAGGFEATKEIMIEAPTPVVIVSDETDSRQVESLILALRAGALAVVGRPTAAHNGEIVSPRDRFVSTIKGMAGVKVVRRWREPARGQVRVPQRTVVPANREPSRIVAIASSTGGPAALQHILAQLPGDFQPPILVVQHIADGFVEGLVTWLNALCSLKVKVAVDGEPLLPHTVYVGPNGYHLGVSGRLRILLSKMEPIGGFRPSATFLFESVAKGFGSSSLHVILTGMGQDGVTGLQVARAAGARIFAQDEASSIVFGMPGAAVEAGVVDSVLPLSAIATEMMAAVQERE